MPDKKSTPAHTAQVTASLQRRLIILFTGLTALVLTVALCITYTMACAQVRASEQALLFSTFTALEDKLRYQNIISDPWLIQQEITAHSVIHIEDNGEPLHFEGAWQTRTPRAQLVQLVRSLPVCASVAAGIPGSRAEATLTVRRGESYTVRAVQLVRATQYAPPVTLYLLQDNSVLLAHEWQLLRSYALLWLCGVLVLLGISGALIRMALRPASAAWQQQTEFIAAAGHELRSPLAVIRASLAAAQPETLPEQQQGFVRAAEREAQRMARLTEDLLLLAAGDAGAWRVQPARLSADTLCIELYERFSALARAGGRTLTLHLPNDPLPHVLADAQYFPQLLSILMQNALEHTPEGTSLEITAQCGHKAGFWPKGQKEAVVFTIVDHGKGIEDADKRAIFERFARADKSRTDKAHFGLGLSVAQEIALLHGASLRVQDTKGGGASFSVALPSV